MDFSIKGIGNIQGKGQTKFILNGILTILSDDQIQEWCKEILIEPLLKLVPKIQRTKTELELGFISTISKLPIQQRDSVISTLYSENNLKQKRESFLGRFGNKLFLNFFITNDIKIPKRPSGYTDKGFYEVDRSKKRRMNEMIEQEKELEVRRMSILTKQLELFERNLDLILEIDPSKPRAEIKDKIFESMKAHVNQNQNKKENDNDESNRE